MQRSITLPFTIYILTGPRLFRCICPLSDIRFQREGEPNRNPSQLMIASSQSLTKLANSFDTSERFFSVRSDVSSDGIARGNRIDRGGIIFFSPSASLPRSGSAYNYVKSFPLRRPLRMKLVHEKRRAFNSRISERNDVRVGNRSNEHDRAISVEREI